MIRAGESPAGTPAAPIAAGVFLARSVVAFGYAGWNRHASHELAAADAALRKGPPNDWKT